MPKYLFQVKYTTEGLKGVLAEGGTRRKEAIEKLVASVNGKLEACYFAFGQTDLFTIASFPDHVTAATVSLFVSAAGGAGTAVTVLLTPEEIDAAVKKAPNYRPPGK